MCCAAVENLRGNGSDHSSSREGTRGSYQGPNVYMIRRLNAEGYYAEFLNAESLILNSEFSNARNGLNAEISNAGFPNSTELD